MESLRRLRAYPGRFLTPVPRINVDGFQQRGKLAMHRIVVLDTPGADLRELSEAFGRAGDLRCEVETVGSLEALLKELRGPKPLDLVVLDYEIGDGVRSGKAALSRIRRAEAQVPVIAVARQGSVAVAAEAVEAGATDFLVRGDRLHERVSTLLGKVRQLLELIDHNRALREQNRLLQQAHQERYHIVGESPQILEVLRQIKRVAKIPRPVLIVAERGTGKELVARAIHEASGRASKPFVVINCAAATETLLESELFGHERGAFTGANSLAYGKFEQADGGTLFLDEIGNMSLLFQQKVLRVVEYGTFTRVGGSKEIRSSARVLAATNADLREAIRQGRFLQDLYDRLSFEVLRVPPLRQREGDIEILARHFLSEFMREIPSLGGKHLSREAIEVLRRYPFPGNVREMKNIIERAAYRDTENEITPSDIDMPAPPISAASGSGGFEDRVEGFKRQLVLDALAQAKGNQAQAARSLGLSYHQFRYHLRKHSAAPQ
jgi:DNA-binding NtrC family response regulator